MSRKPASVLRPEAASVILDSVADGVFTVDADWRITSFNRAAAQITGIPQEVALGRPCSDVFRTTACESACVLRQTMRTGRPIINRTIFLVNPQGDKVPISVSTALLRDRQGTIIGGVETFRDLSVVEELRAQLAERRHPGGIITRDPTLTDLLALLPRIAESEATILILGESGTGKELLARAVHELSPRRKNPLVVVNCAALPENLLESELFGYKAGAFTDARRDKPGRFALAEGGTLFFDEIGELSPALQVKLLRVIQERVFEPLGSVRPVSANVRIISATNRDLTAMVAAGTFRADLFYRINVMTCRLPPLRARPTDIALLADHFIKRFNAGRNQPVTGITPAALDLLTAHPFPGNVRELENLIERAFILCFDGPLCPEHLPIELRQVALNSLVPNDRPSERLARRASSVAHHASNPSQREPLLPSIESPSDGHGPSPVPRSSSAPAVKPPPDSIFPKTMAGTGKAKEQVSRRPSPPEQSAGKRLQDIEAEFLRQMLREHGGRRGATAAALGIHPATLWRKMKRLLGPAK
jgi:PAS domain S-box-containing protein